MSYETVKSLCVKKNLQVKGTVCAKNIKVKNLHANNITALNCLNLPKVDIETKTPEQGCLVYNIKDDKLYYGNGTIWIGPLAIAPPKPLAIEGYWIANSVISSDPVFPLLYFFRDKDGLLVCKFFAGTTKNIRELTDEDIAVSYIQTTPTGFDAGRDSKFVYPINGDFNSISFFTSQDDTFIGEDYEVLTFKVQDDLETAYYLNFCDFKNYGYVQETSRYVKIDKDLLPPIQKWGAPSIGPNYSDPVTMFEYAYNCMYLNGNIQIAKQLDADAFPGFNKWTEIKNKIRDEGILHESYILNIFTTKIIEQTFGPLTTIFTIQDHGANCGSIAHIDGLKGEYQVINGDWPVSIVQINRNNPQIIPKAGFYDLASGRNMFNISLDTSLINVPYNPEIHGQGHVSIRNGPLSPTSEYRELIAALGELNTAIGGPGTHNRGEIASLPEKRSQVLSTFADVQAALNTNPVNDVFVDKMRARIYTRNGSTSFYVNPALTEFNDNPVFRNTLINDPFSINPTEDSIFNYSIDIRNYLEPGTFRNIYWRIVENPEDKVYPINQMLVDFGYPTNGTRFEFIVSETNPGFPYVIGSDNGIMEWTEPDYPREGLKIQYYCGLINKQFTNGEIVGYIRLQDFLWPIDGPFYLSTFEGFWDKQSQEAGLPNGGNNSIKAYATMVQYLNSLGATRIIYDNRNNAGGLTSQDFSYCFGADRSGTKVLLVGNSDGQGPVEILNELVEEGVQSGAGNIASYLETVGTTKPSAVEKVIPNGVFKNGRITILTSVTAASDGDLLCNRFLGDDGNSLNIGNGVTVTFVGDLDGRNLGAAELQYPYPVLKDAYRLEQDGISVSPWFQNSELPAGSMILFNGHWLGNFNDILKPSLLLNYWYDRTVWLDLGYIKPYPEDSYHLPKTLFTKPQQNGGNPDPDKQESWRDSPLEAAILQ